MHLSKILTLSQRHTLNEFPPRVRIGKSSVVAYIVYNAFSAFNSEDRRRSPGVDVGGPARLRCFNDVVFVALLAAVLRHEDLDIVFAAVFAVAVAFVVMV